MAAADVVLESARIARSTEARIATGSE